MNLSSKHKGNIALARALSYFGEKGYYLFLPVGDNGGAIDLAVSEDGINLQRVQCKYSARRHTSMLARYPDQPIWTVSLQQTGRQVKNGRIIGETVYDVSSFDWLFVSTPSGDYLIDWKLFYQEVGRTPTTIVLGGKKTEKYRLPSS
jgi:hypothetical protein